MHAPFQLPRMNHASLDGVLHKYTTLYLGHQILQLPFPAGSGHINRKSPLILVYLHSTPTNCGLYYTIILKHSYFMGLLMQHMKSWKVEDVFELNVKGMTAFPTLGAHAQRGLR